MTVINMRSPARIRGQGDPGGHGLIEGEPMASPAPARAPEPDLDPLLSAWGNVQRLAAIAAEGARLAAAELAERPDCPRAQRRAEILAAAVTELAEVARRAAFDEAALDAEHKVGYEEGIAACRAARCRLKAVGG